jgi:excisionase family DNA binding protein
MKPYPKRPAQVEALTMSDVAERLQLSEATCYRLCRAGQLPAVKVGRSWRMDPRELDGLLTSV